MGITPSDVDALAKSLEVSDIKEIHYKIGELLKTLRTLTESKGEEIPEGFNNELWDKIRGDP